MTLVQWERRIEELRTQGELLYWEPRAAELRFNPNHDPKTGRFTSGAGVDVTNEYLRSATPGKGSITYDSGYDKNKYEDEVKAAEWLHSTLGGDIKLLAETKTCKMADYLWNNKLWDLKKPTTEKAVNSLIRKGLKQILRNPGGIILDYSSHEISMNLLIEHIDKRMKWYEGKKVDILIAQNDKVVKVLRYK